MTNKTEYVGYEITRGNRYYRGVVQARIWNWKRQAYKSPTHGDMPALPRGYMGSGVAIREAILEHGESAFERKVLARFDNLQDAEAWERDNVVMQEQDPLSYNLQSGGKIGFKAAKSTRAKISKALMGENNPNYGGGAGTGCFQSGKAHPNYGKFGADSPKYNHDAIRTPSGHISKAKPK